MNYRESSDEINKNLDNFSGKARQEALGLYKGIVWVAAKAYDDNASVLELVDKDVFISSSVSKLNSLVKDQVNRKIKMGELKKYIHDYIGDYLDQEVEYFNQLEKVFPGISDRLNDLESIIGEDLSYLKKNIIDYGLLEFGDDEISRDMLAGLILDHYPDLSEKFRKNKIYFDLGSFGEVYDSLKVDGRGFRNSQIRSIKELAYGAAAGILSSNPNLTYKDLREANNRLKSFGY